MARYDILSREALWHFGGLLSCGENIYIYKKSVDLLGDKHFVLMFKRQ